MNPRTLLRRAFTLVEMLVVIIIITALLLIAVPNFQAMLNSSEAALAESQLKAGLRAAKDAALRSTGDQDAAAVFSFAPGGRMTIGIYVQVASFNDRDGATNDLRRDVFVPSGVNEPIQLPRGWMVRAYAPPYSTSQASSTDGIADPCMQWYESYPGRRPLDYTESNWIFPETHFYDTADAADGQNRQTFMVRFQAGSGTMKVGGGDPCLVFMPGANAPWRSGAPYSPSYRADQTDDPAKFIARIMNAPLSGPPHALSTQDRLDLIGSSSSDVVLAKPVSQLALYEEAKLAAALGVRADRTTECIYLPFEPGTSISPELVPRTDFANYAQDIRRWIMGDTNLDGSHIAVAGGEVADAPEARIYTIDRYTGALQPVEVQ